MFWIFWQNYINILMKYLSYIKGKLAVSSSLVEAGWAREGNMRNKEILF